MNQYATVHRMSTPPITLEPHGDYWLGRFSAMASPCEILMDVDDEATAHQLTMAAYQEAIRIEQKFSRYQQDNILYRTNHSHGVPIEVDDETAALLDYAAHCYALSDGKFDITSGVLRKVWRFDGSDRVPTAAAVKDLLAHVGWPKVTWQRPWITLPANMEIDLGGIGKEYAVDRTAVILQQLTTASLLINYGGDLCATGPRRNKHGWIVGVEDPGTIQKKRVTANRPHSTDEFELLRGGIATSGDTRRYLLKEGIRYCHILDPQSGWPVRGAPHAITVAAGTCTDAGILATLAMLHGKQAETFLRKQKIRFWCQR